MNAGNIPISPYSKIVPVWFNVVTEGRGEQLVTQAAVTVGSPSCQSFLP